MGRKFKKIMGLTLSLCLVFSGFAGVIKSEKYASAKIRISAKKATIYVGKYKQLKLKGITAKKQKKVKWKSKNKKIVKVGKHGKIKGIKKGRAYVIATFKGKKYKCLVTVKKAAGSSSEKDVEDTIVNSASKTVSINTMQVVMGENYSTTRSRLGSPARTAKSVYGTNVCVFRLGASSNYKNILYVLEKDGKVVGAYSISPNANYANIAKSGMTAEQLEKNGFYQNTNSGMSGLYFYEDEDCFVEAYVDYEKTKKVYAIRTYSKDYDFDTMMRSDYNTDNYKKLTSVTYNGIQLYVSNEYDKELIENMNSYRQAVGLSTFTVYSGCGREMAEIGGSKGYSSASDYSDDEKSIMKKAVSSSGSGQIKTSLRSMFAGDTYSDPFTVVTNWSELDATSTSLTDTSFNCIMAGFAANTSTGNTYTYVVLWGANKGALA
ncbi:MAG: Ig-like domain-containing protein [Lachnospiraceae bacterium]|nr:Ig-like domain-containing protein [Lachnospiraceae bacterium]